MRIFIRNLSKQVEEGDLVELFEPYGEVSSVTLLTDKASGRRVGFGFVGMSTKDQALSAINALRGSSLKGKLLEFHDCRSRFERRQLVDRRQIVQEPPTRRRVSERRASA